MREIEFTGRGGIVLRGDRWDGDGADVLMLHGGGQTRHSWKSAGTNLAARRFQVTSMDTRGHGRSAWAPDGDYSIRAMTDDILAVLDTIARPAVIVGASMGGLTGLLATRRRPVSVSALVLVDIVPSYEVPGTKRIKDFLVSGAAGFDSLDEAADAVAAYLPHRTRPRSTDGLLHNWRTGKDGRWYWHWDPGFLRSSGTDPMSQTEHLREAARELSVPVLLIHGALSDVVSSEGVSDFRTLVPHLRVVEMRNAAHTAAGDDNDAFTAAVVDFVSTVEEPPESPSASPAQ